jgi:hypothetical protein
MMSAVGVTVIQDIQTAFTYPLNDAFMFKKVQILNDTNRRNSWGTMCRL